MGKQYKAIIVDDERLARVKLAKILAKFDCIEILGEAEDVPSAKKLIYKVNPNLLFLDIQMPQESGFDLLNQIEFNGEIVFVTAYDEYAIKAFEVNALDYLLKPVREERIETLINKLVNHYVDKSLPKKLEYDDKIFISNEKQMGFIELKDIISIESIGNYSKIHFQNHKNIIVYKTLKDWENRLPENKFFRIHRTCIINIDYIDRFEKWFNYTTRVFMKSSETPLKISKKFASQLKKRFGL